MQKRLNLIFIFILFALGSTAQKLPNVQEQAVRASVITKIDGKTTEWGNKFQAYNKNVEAWYALANDDDNLYLVIQATNPRVINKMLGGGVTVSVDKSGKKQEANVPAISFPMMNYARTRFIVENMNNKTAPRDSLVTANRQLLADNAKEIKIAGISGLTDTVAITPDTQKDYFSRLPYANQPGQFLSVNNNSGIQAAGTFDKDMAYTYELAIPLKYLNLPPGAKFSYHVVFNSVMYRGAGFPPPGYMMTWKRINGENVNPNMDLENSTDFWGDYTLATP